MASQVFSYTSASYLAQAVGLVNGVVIRRALGPALMGTWGILQIFLDYAGYAQFGVLSATSREIPFWEGKGDRQKSEAIRHVTFTFSLVSSLAVGCALASYAVGWGGWLSRELRVGLVVVGALIVLQRLANFYAIMMRSYQDFKLLSRMMILVAGVDLVAIWGLVIPFKLYGLWVATGISFLAMSWMSARWTGYAVRWRWDWRELKPLLRLGMSLLILGGAFMTLKQIDRIMIAAALGQEALGYYSIPMMVTNYAFGFSTSVSVVLFPRLQEAHAQGGEDREQLRSYAVRATTMLASAVVLVLGLLHYLVPPFVKQVLPAYEPALPAFQILLIGTFFISFANQVNSILITLNKQTQSLWIVASAMAAGIGMNAWAIRQGWGIEGVAAGTSVMFVLYSLGLWCYTMAQFGKIRQAMATYGRLVVPALYALGVTAVIKLGMPLADTWWGAATQSTLFLLAMIPVIWGIEREVHLLRWLWAKVSRDGRFR